MDCQYLENRFQKSVIPAEAGIHLRQHGCPTTDFGHDEKEEQIGKHSYMNALVTVIASIQSMQAEACGYKNPPLEDIR